MAAEKNPKQKINDQKAEPKESKPSGHFLNNLKKFRRKNLKPLSRSKEIGRDLKIIYQDSQGKMPNMAKLELGNKNKFRNVILLIITSLLVIFTVAVLGFVVFQPEAKFSNEKVSLEIKAPFSAISGEKINYQIKITNGEEVSLTHTQLIVYLPNGFRLENSSLPPLIQQNETGEPIISSVKTWSLNDLYSNQFQVLEITGTLIGTLNSKQTISATLSYIPSNFNSEFQKNSSFTTEINDNLLTTKLEYPSQIADQDITEFDLTIKNKSNDQNLNSLQIELAYPSEFTLLESQISTAGSQTPVTNETKLELTNPKIWSIESLLPQEEKQLKFKGKFTVSETKNLELNLSVKLKGQNDEYISQAEEKIDVQVIKGDLLTSLIIEGSNQNKAVDFGQTLNYLLNIQNKSKKTLGDVKIRAVLDSPFLDWKSLSDSKKGIVEDNQILWTKEQIPGLALLLPEAEISLNLQINLKNYQKSGNYNADDYQVKNFFEAQINKINNNDASIIVPSNTIINEINSDLNLVTAGRYFDDQSNTLGSGPLPPIVDQKTSYKIFWTLTNSLNEVKDIQVKAKLPDYVVFADQQKLSTGNLFKTEQNEIIWQINRLPTTVNKVIAEFDISLTPSSKDVNKILTLLPETTVVATDAKTQGTIQKTSQGITTNLDSDPLGKGKGLIQSAQ